MFHLLDASILSRVEWRNGMPAPMIVSVVGRPCGAPKKPVIWHGEIWLLVPAEDPTKLEKDVRAWRANKPLTRQQAQAVLAQLLEQLIGEHGTDAAVDSGFWMQSR